VYWFFSRSRRRRFSRSSSGSCVASSAQSDVAGAFRPVPAGDHGGAGSNGDVGQAERPQPGPEVAGPAGFLPAPRVPGPVVRHVHVEIDPRLPARGDQHSEHPGHAVLDPAGHPGVLRRHARGRLPLPQVSGLVERQPGADLVVRVIGQYLLRELRQCRPDRFPSPFPPAEQGLDQVRPLVPGLPRQLPRVRPGFPRQPADVVHCGREGAPLLHGPGQQPSDQRICPLRAFCGILLLAAVQGERR
jgi:hypothetical protein